MEQSFRVASPSKSLAFPNGGKRNQGFRGTRHVGVMFRLEVFRTAAPVFHSIDAKYPRLPAWRINDLSRLRDETAYKLTGHGPSRDLTGNSLVE